MSDWQHDIAAATAAAEQKQAAEAVAEAKFDAIYVLAEASGKLEQAPTTEEFRDWMAARKATDAAWGSWSEVMDSKPD
jgi:hypothetical protein